MGRTCSRGEEQGGEDMGDTCHSWSLHSVTDNRIGPDPHLRPHLSLSETRGAQVWHRAGEHRKETHTRGTELIGARRHG
ncbi:hypothetical protein AAFF_G00071430 [Aldrovandia affinis]|uniref:Uncharacterized protein n=1 Tax=Aldrovandia affinis TaxID=143900 RepID=A0AAD7WEF9_9TELE|nr:hypothetical protein AAFF_G00071430 [Aldrovandia affinis]